MEVFLPGPRAAAPLSLGQGRACSFRYRMSTESNTIDLITCNFVPKSISWPKLHSSRTGWVPPLLAMSRGGDYGIKYDDEANEVPLWIVISKDIMRALKSLFAFLVQQPGQLKYIEWPTFQDTAIFGPFWTNCTLPSELAENCHPHTGTGSHAYCSFIFN